jgi:hypothetical protein
VFGPEAQQKYGAGHIIPVVHEAPKVAAVRRWTSLSSAAFDAIRLRGHLGVDEREAEVRRDEPEGGRGEERRAGGRSR